MNYTPEEIHEAKARADEGILSFFKQEIPVLMNKRLQSAPTTESQHYFSQSPEDYIKGDFLSVVGNLYTPDEISFIRKIGEDFKRVGYGLAYFSLLPPSERPAQALALTKKQLRTGWLHTGVPLSLVQTVDDHQDACAFLARICFPDYPLVAKHVKVHDVGEAAVGDFTRHDAISPADKTRIEALAIKLICCTAAKLNNEAALLLQETFDIYESNAPEQTPLRSMMKDCDLLEMPYEIIFLMEKCPADMKAEIIPRFQEFWDYVDSKLVSNRAKDFFDVLQTARNGLTCPSQELIASATDYMLARQPERNHLSQLIFTQKELTLRHTVMRSKQALATQISESLIGKGSYRLTYAS